MDLREWNERIVAEFRAHGGHVRWSDDDDLAAGRPIPPVLPGFAEADGAPVILVHHVGARTGTARITPLMYLPVGDDFAIFATYGGSPKHPAWFHNLTAHPRTTVETKGGVVPVTARVTEGPERARIWSAQVARMPAFESFQDTTERVIPVVLLERRA